MEVKDPEITIKELKQELDCVRCMAKESDAAASKFKQEYEQAEKRVVELEYRIRFLEGQTEAYKNMCRVRWGGKL